MAVLSKPVWVSPTCYELGHCWTPYCTKASTDVAKNVFTEALKIYGTLYMMAGLLQKKGLKYYLRKFIPETLQSSVFLTINGTMFISMFCLWRHMLGCMYLLTASFIPAFSAAFTAVLFERKSRRGPLAVYLTNLAIETGYRMLVERKLVSPIANGEEQNFCRGVIPNELLQFESETVAPSSTKINIINIHRYRNLKGRDSGQIFGTLSTSTGTEICREGVLGRVLEFESENMASLALK
ncbi:transmembrane protein 135 [Plakobranchus ocellatus]|uniref:Transmembrane protein 135 n=1 Tax=Plakobranchus ocellatus TaxID=259542 RepID=A0AAV4AFL5_9GAST|nr:transmembrane protein 135 [Plakobranchus ocellatus]